MGGPFVRCAAALGLGLLFWSGAAQAQTYPTRQITLVAPFPAGGAVDAIGRLLAERMQETLGQPVILENVTGAAGSVGPGRVARAPNDGYTLSLGTSGTHVLNAAAMNLTYDVLKDFEPIAPLSIQPLLIVARKDLPAKDLKELIAWVRTNQDKVSQGTAGVGSTNHLTGILFQQKTNTSYAMVPYRGTNLAMQDLVVGRIDMIFDLASLATPLVKAGTIKAYAVTGKSRLPALPDVPTVDEAGLPGFYSSIWMGLWAPKGTPQEVIAKLNTAVRAALENPILSKRLADLGHDLFPSDQRTPEALAALQKRDADTWWPIARTVKPK